MQAAGVAAGNAVQFEQFGEMAATGLWSWVQGLFYWGILALGVLAPFVGGASSLLFK